MRITRYKVRDWSEGWSSERERERERIDNIIAHITLQINENYCKINLLN